MKRPFRRIAWALIAGFAVGHGLPAPTQAQDDPTPAPAPEIANPQERVQDPPPAADADPNQPAPAGDPLPGPAPIPDVKIAPTLKTIPIARNKPPGPNELVVESTILPRDNQGIWILNFMCKPVRIRTVNVPGKGFKQVYYLYYRVVNRTGQPRMFVPQFTLVTDSGKRYDDEVIPSAVPIIQAREDNSIPLRGAVDIAGILPPSTKENVDDAVYGVAVWSDVDPSADSFKIYVRGLSDGYQVVIPAAQPNAPAAKPANAKPVAKYKALRLDFASPGDEINRTEREIRFEDRPYEWVYY